MRIAHQISLIRDLFCRTPRSRRNSSAARDPRRRILVVRLDRIGDFSLYLPFAAALRRRFPQENYHITLLGNSLWMPLARRMLNFDRFIELDPQCFLRDAAQRRALLDEIAEIDCDLLLQPRFHRELLLEDLIALTAAAPESLAFSGTTQHIRKRLLLRPWSRPYSRLLGAAFLQNAHELVKNRYFLEHAAPSSEPISNPWQTRPHLPEHLADLAGCIVILPGSGKPGLSWPSADFGVLAATASRLRRPVAVTGTKAEQETANAVIAAAGIPIANLAGKLDIESFTALIANASLVIGNDTGGIHIAALSGVSSLVILGQGQPGIFLPYPENGTGIPGIRLPVPVTLPPLPCAGCGWLCRYHNTPREFHCLRIPVELASSSLEKLTAAMEIHPL